MTLPLKKEEKPRAKTDPVFKKAVALYEQGRIDEACEGYRECLRDNPDHASAWLNLGMVLRQQGHSAAALVCSKRALEVSPNNTAYLMNYGNCLSELGRKDESLAAHAAAASARPDDFLIRRNYAVALREFGEFGSALLHFTAAQRLRPRDISLEWEIALTYLYMGRFKEGWPAFEIRWKLPQMKERDYHAPRWRGEDLRGKTILIHEEQGFGDSILCSRYIPMVSARGGRVILECKKTLHRLFSSLPGVDRIVEPNHALTDLDYYIPMMSLPGVFGTDLDSMPPPPALYVPPSAPPAVERLLNLGQDRFRIGIVWSGSVTFANNQKRAVEAERFLALAGIPGVQLYSLQKGPRENDLPGCGAAGLVHELGPHLNDFADTSATLKKLDLVIMTDSSVAHLAGSLGVPVWNLLSYRPYWLYLSERADCPWYPSMHLFRQPEPGDWDAVFKKAASVLEYVARKEKVVH